MKKTQSEIIEELKKENEELKALIKKITFRQGIDKVLLGFHESNFASAAADLLINPNPISIHGTEKGIGFDFKVSLKDIIAIESKKRIKGIYLKEPVIPVEGGKARIKIETNEGFDTLLKRLQGSGHHILRVSEKYAINIYHYRLAEKGKFILSSDLPKGLDDKLKVINTEKKFDRDLYHTRLMEIDRLGKHHHDFSVNLEKIEEINRYKNR
jgi:hypothetical protein